MSDDRSVKRYLAVGAVIGGIISIRISLLMDSLFSDALKGTWRDAIVSDLNKFFHFQTSPDTLIVYLIFGIILLILGGFGALMGVIFTFFIIKFFALLKA